jgi:hypothetical protein
MVIVRKKETMETGNKRNKVTRAGTMAVLRKKGNSGNRPEDEGKDQELLESWQLKKKKLLLQVKDEVKIY